MCEGGLVVDILIWVGEVGLKRRREDILWLEGVVWKLGAKYIDIIHLDNGLEYDIYPLFYIESLQ